MIACTTPVGSQNFPEYMIGGVSPPARFSSMRSKARMIAYPSRVVDRGDLEKQTSALVHDLTRISELKGEFRLTADAYAWGNNGTPSTMNEAFAPG